MTDDSSTSFKFKDLALSTQKKFATKIASTDAIRNKLIDDESERLFQTIDEIFKLHCGDDKKRAEKLMKDSVKIIVKLGVLERANKLDKQLSYKTSTTLKNVVMTLISFSEVDFSFDKNLAESRMKNLRDDIQNLLKSGKVQPKTHGRIDNIFSVLADGEFLHKFYVGDTRYDSLRQRLTNHLNYAVEHKRI